MVCEENAKRFCCEPIENIENYKAAMADKTQTWDCQHRLEIQGQFRNSVELLKKCGVYYNVPASQLIFLKHSDHLRLHHLSAEGNKEFRRRISEIMKGRSKGGVSVRMTSLSSGEVKDFCSTREAERWLRSHGFPKANRANIWFCCNRQRNAKFAYGATWKIADSAE